METFWVLILILQTNSGVAMEKIEFATRDLCVGARTYLVENIEVQKTSSLHRQSTIQGMCVQKRRNTPR